MNSEEVPVVESNVAHWLTWKLMSATSANCNCSRVSIFLVSFCFLSALVDNLKNSIVLHFLQVEQSMDALKKCA